MSVFSGTPEEALHRWNKVGAMIWGSPGVGKATAYKSENGTIYYYGCSSLMVHALFSMTKTEIGV